MSVALSNCLNDLRCPSCVERLGAVGDARTGTLLACQACSELFPIIDGIPRMLLRSMREALVSKSLSDGVDLRQVQTAKSFGFEWSRFSQMYDEWESAFFEYMQPHGPSFFQGKRVLDAGCGSGRYAYHAAKHGAKVWAVDLGPAIEITQHNTATIGGVYAVQADILKLPFAPESFDFICSIGVLHHLANPEEAFHNLLRYLKPGGEIQIYVYWKPENQPVKTALLSLISALRGLTTRLPYRVVYALSYPAAAIAWATFVWPYLMMKYLPGCDTFASRTPMRQYAAYPFRVCVNDQFDRFSAPIENRYTRSEVEFWLRHAGLEEPLIIANYGWVASGRKPVVKATSQQATARAAEYSRC